MPRTRNPYPAEFREQIVALARTGRCVEDLAREFAIGSTFQIGSTTTKLFHLTKIPVTVVK